MKDRRNLERDAAALVKLVLTELEQVGALPPEVAAEPYASDERRRRVVRAIWVFVREALKHVDA